MKPEQIKKWFKYGDDDFDIAKLIMNQSAPSYHNVCLHCQQAVEKYLKAFVMYKTRGGVRFTHDLDYIMRQVFLIADEEEIREFNLFLGDIIFLGDFDRDIKYPPDDMTDIDEETAQTAIKSMEKVRKMSSLQNIRIKLSKS